jgi:hypothetical protein
VVSLYLNSCILTSFTLPFARHFYYIIIIIIISQFFYIVYRQGTYMYIPTTNNVSRLYEYSVAGVQYLQCVLHVMFFRT